MNGDVSGRIDDQDVFLLTGRWTARSEAVTGESSTSIGRRDPALASVPSVLPDRSNHVSCLGLVAAVRYAITPAADDGNRAVRGPDCHRFGDRHGITDELTTRRIEPTRDQGALVYEQPATDGVPSSRRTHRRLVSRVMSGESSAPR